MAARLQRSWDDNDKDIENTEKDIEQVTRKDIDRKVISEEMQQAVLTVH